jgi:hypothetical protein
VKSEQADLAGKREEQQRSGQQAVNKVCSMQSKR